MIKTFKFEIKPTKQQRKEFAKGFGTRRWVYNWGLSESIRAYEEDNIRMNAFSLDPMLNKLREEDPENYGWIGEVNTMIKSEALKDLGLSLQAHRRLLSKAKRNGVNTNPNKGKPKFKKRGKGVESFRLFKKYQGTFKITSKYHLNFNWTRVLGRMTVKSMESLEFLRNSDIKTMTISFHAGKYFASLTYEKTNHSKTTQDRKPKIGLDLGIKHSAVTFDGERHEVFNLPETIKQYERISDTRREKLSHMQGYRKGETQSVNFKKQLLLVQKADAKIARIRKDFLHKLTTKLCKNYEHVMIDDFSFKSYLTIVNNARHAYRIAPCMLKMILETKAENYQVQISYVPKGTATTQTCSTCGEIKQEANKMHLADRTYKCEKCGTEIDRDINSAINVYKLMT